MAQSTLNPKRLIVSGTAAHRGRKISVSPTNSDLAHLNYGRICLDEKTSSAAFDTEGRETALLTMRGRCSVTVDGATHELDTYDAIYIPRGSHVEVKTTSEVDLVEC